MKEYGAQKLLDFGRISDAGFCALPSNLLLLGLMSDCRGR